MPTKSAAPKIWTKEERAAMREGARERKVTTGSTPADERADGLRDLQESLAKMQPDDRAMAEGIHQVLSAAVPALVPKTW